MSLDGREFQFADRADSRPWSAEFAHRKLSLIHISRAAGLSYEALCLHLLQHASLDSARA